MGLLELYKETLLVSSFLLWKLDVFCSVVTKCICTRSFLKADKRTITFLTEDMSTKAKAVVGNQVDPTDTTETRFFGAIQTGRDTFDM